MADQFQSLLVSSQSKDFHHIVQAVAQAEIDLFEIESTGFDLGKVQDIIDDRQKRVGRSFHHTEIIALLRGEFRVESKFRHSEDSVHGRTNLVTHIGEKLALSAARRFGSFLGALQFLGTLPHQQHQLLLSSSHLVNPKAIKAGPHKCHCH